MGACRHNNEGYAIIGYRLASYSIGEEWMLLEFGITVRDGVPYYKLTRDDLSLETPDGKTLPLPTVQEDRAANLQALQAREKVQRDSINYSSSPVPIWGTAMTLRKSSIGLALSLLMTLVMAGCNDVGVGGLGVSYPCARWRSGATGPGVIVTGPGYP